jgi:hypothetical protein
MDIDHPIDNCHTKCRVHYPSWNFGKKWPTDRVVVNKIEKKQTKNVSSNLIFNDHYIESIKHSICSLQSSLTILDPELRFNNARMNLLLSLQIVYGNLIDERKEKEKEMKENSDLIKESTHPEFKFDSITSTSISTNVPFVSEIKVDSIPMPPFVSEFKVDAIPMPPFVSEFKFDAIPMPPFVSEFKFDAIPMPPLSEFKVDAIPLSDIIPLSVPSLNEFKFEPIVDIPSTANTGEFKADTTVHSPTNTSECTVNTSDLNKNISATVTTVSQLIHKFDEKIENINDSIQPQNNKTETSPSNKTNNKIDLLQSNNTINLSPCSSKSDSSSKHTSNSPYIVFENDSDMSSPHVVFSDNDSDTLSETKNNNNHKDMNFSINFNNDSSSDDDDDKFIVDLM